MRHPWRSSIMLAGLLLAIPGGASQAQAPLGCEDQLRATRVLADRYQRSRTQSEVETAAVIADLLKQIEQLTASLHAATAQPKPEAPKP